MDYQSTYEWSLKEPENFWGEAAQAIHWDRFPVTDIVKTFTYRELREAVVKFAGALRNQGVKQGDRVIIYMPMIPEALIAMYACARIGVVS